MRALLQANELAALPRICGLVPPSRPERTEAWLLLDAAVAEVPAFNVAAAAGPPLRPRGLEVVEADSAGLLEQYGGIGWAASGRPALRRLSRGPDGFRGGGVQRRGGKRSAAEGHRLLHGRPALQAGRLRGASIGYLRARPGVGGLHERLGSTRAYDTLSLRSQPS